MEMQIGFLESTQKIKHNHPQAWGRSNSQLTTPGEAHETRKTLTPDKTTISLRISKVRLENQDLARRVSRTQLSRRELRSINPRMCPHQSSAFLSEQSSTPESMEQASTEESSPVEAFDH